MSTPVRNLFLAALIAILAACGGGGSSESSPEDVAQQSINQADSYAELLATIPLTEPYKELLNSYDGSFDDYPDALVWSGGDYAPVNGSYYSYEQKQYPSANGILKLF